MRVIILLCLATAYVAVVRGQCPNCDDPSPEMAAQMEANGKRLNELVARAVFLNNKLAQRKQDRDTAEIESQNMLQRIERRNGGLCNGQFVCGGNTNQCVDNLLVCDGEADCDSGADESDSVCTNPAQPGSRFEGVTVYDTCTSREPKRVGMDFINEDRNNNVKSNLYVTAQLRMYYKLNGVNGEDSLPLEGIYYYGRRMIEFKAPEQDMLGVDVEFLPGNDDVMHAYAVRVTSGERCAKFILKRV